MAAVPAKPGEGHTAVYFRPLPLGAVHHRKPLSKDVHARESASLEDLASALAFEEGKPQQHDDAGAQLQRVRNELLGELERWVCYDGFAAVRGLALHQEIAAVEVCWISVINEIAANNLVAGRAQHAHDGARTACRLPKSARQLLDPQQRLDRHARSFVKIISSHSERAPLDLA